MQIKEILLIYVLYVLRIKSIYQKWGAHKDYNNLHKITYYILFRIIYCQRTPQS